MQLLTSSSDTDLRLLELGALKLLDVARLASLCLVLLAPGLAVCGGKGPGGDAAAALPPSALTPPLEEMKVRWDGSRSEAGGMKTFDSPRFGMTRDAGGRAHTGLDLEAPVGTPVFAVADGVVDLARYGDTLFGNDVLLVFRPTQRMLSYLARVGSPDDDGVLFAHYAHLSAVFVETGQVVKRGTMVGRTGTTGNADQKYPHLHFEVRKIRWPGVGLAGLRNRIDPERMFKVDFSTPVEAVTRGR
jgi:murein DD-endopeptidase MepM/ murein hydrolase activator NlpD